MKNRNKFLVSLALSAGVIATFGASYALYINADSADPLKIQIGSVTTHTDSTATLSYKVGEVSSKKYDTDSNSWIDWGDDKLNPTYNKVQITAPLSFEYSSDYSGAKQPYIGGTLGITVSLSENIPDGTTVSANLTGYNTEYSGSYFAIHKQGKLFNGNSDGTSVFSSTTRSYTSYISTAIDKDSISAVIELDFSNSLTSSKFLDLAETTNAYSISLSWGEYDTEHGNDENLKPGAYMIGDMTDWDTKKLFEDYALVPNLKNTEGNVEWMYSGLTNASMVKVYDKIQSSPWISCKSSNTLYYQEGGNAKITSTDMYTVTYKRGDSEGFWITKTN